MPVTIHNTETDALETVAPSDGRTLRMYCCGPTVYAAAHIGNFRTFIVQDVFRRVCEMSGLKVKHVRNLTNVDDKTIRTAVQSGRPLKEITDEWTDKFHADCEALNLLSPTIEPGAVEHIPEQIRMIETLMEKGFAYQGGDGSVYFRISSFPEYGRLSGVKDRELTTDNAPRDSDEYDRESLADFVMWKAAKPEDGENVWESPWGSGRPGWHIECSAMSMKYLGETFDIHSGGVDLCFPHHENEIAQSEASTGKLFVRQWFHVVHLMVDGKKMSKSLGNLYTLDDLLAKGFSAAEVRYALVSGHYRKHLNFTFETVDAARGNLQRLARLVQQLETQTGESLPDYRALSTHSFSEESGGVFAEAFTALQDNLNVAKAMGEVFRAAGILEKNPAQATASDLWGLARILEGIGLELPALESVEAPPEVMALAEARDHARRNKEWAESDRLRDEIQAKGWSVRDVPGGFDLEQR